MMGMKTSLPSKTPSSTSVTAINGEDWFLHFQDKHAYGRVVHLQPAKWINDWLYVRNVGNVINWTNNIVSNTGAVWSNQSKTGVPTFQNNVYFNCAKLNVADVEDKTNMFADEAGKVADPEYKDAAKGDFTIGNESVKKLGVGDPRW